MCRLISVKNILFYFQNELGYTALHQAAQQGHTQIVNMLLESNASPNTLSIVSCNLHLVSGSDKAQTSIVDCRHLWTKLVEWPMGGKAKTRCNLGMLMVNDISHSYLNLMKLEN